MFQIFADQWGLNLKNGIISIAEALTLSDSRPGQIAAAIIFCHLHFWALVPFSFETPIESYSIAGPKSQSF